MNDCLSESRSHHAHINNQSGVWQEYRDFLSSSCTSLRLQGEDMG